MSADRPAVSVVVPTRERSAKLRRCLAALAAQTYPHELVVADDGPQAARQENAAAVGAAGGRLVTTGGAGPAAARNAGARAARGELICFIDDDCEAEPGWIEALARACPPGGAAAGETTVADPDDAAAVASQVLTSELQHAFLRSDGSLGFAPTCNLAVSRELLARVPFDEAYPLAAGEDRAWCARAEQLGRAPVYVPQALVRHSPALGLGGFCSQQLRYGRGAALLRRRGVPLAPAGVRRRLLRAAFGHGWRVGALVALAQLAVAAGYAGERLAHSRSRGD